MARGINKAIIVGTLGKDPEIRYTQGGNAIANISVATNESWKDKNSGEMVEKTEWHRIVCFGKLAEIIERYLKKGSQAYFEGKIQTRKWQDNNGNDRYSTEIVANEMQMLGDKQAHDNSDHRPQPQRPMQNDDGPAKAPVDDGLDSIPF